MNFETLKIKTKETYVKTCSQDINEQNISNLTLIKILIKKFEEVNFPNWVFQNDQIQFNQEDIRFQLWARMEMVTTYYYHNLKLTIENHTSILEEYLKLGYDLVFASQSLLYKEVYDRTCFLSTFFFDVEYFIQQVNTEINFIESSADKKKSHYLKALLEFLDMENENVAINNVIEDVNRLNESKLLIKGKDRNLEYYLIFDYISTLRNCFHNNGYSQKNLNNLNIGGIKIEIKKGEQASMDHGVIFILTFMMISILEKISLKLVEDYPTIWKDKYLHELRENIEKNRLR